MGPRKTTSFLRLCLTRVQPVPLSLEVTVEARLRLRSLARHRE